MVENEKELICIDPDSQCPYRLNLNSGKFRCEQISRDAERRLSQEVRGLSSLKAFELCDWEFASEACGVYRGRNIRSALLQENASQYPVYTTSRELSSAFADKTDIFLLVDAAHYLAVDRFFPVASSSADQFASFRLVLEQKQLHVKASLVTSASETIRHIVSDAYKHFGVEIRPDSEGNEFILKVKGKREYLSGNFPLLAFESIRAILRETSTIEVRLMDVPTQTRDFFPPVIAPAQELPNQIPYALFWYPPEKLRTSDVVSAQTSSGPQLRLPRLHSLLGSRPKASIDESARLLLSGSSLPPLDSSTGECDWPLRIGLLGCERLGRVLLDGLWGNATKAGICSPSCVVIPKNKKEKQTTHSSSAASLSDGEGRIQTQPSIRSSSSAGLFSPFTNLNIGCGSAGSSLAAAFKLPFSLKQLRFEVLLIYGESTLTYRCDRQKRCARFSQPVPFAFNVKFSEWIDFEVPISSVPKETRVCVNIYGIGFEGEFIIGCASKTLYDEFGHIRTGLHTLNIWPFYKVEARLACMTDFWGVSDVRVPKAVSLADLGDAATEPGYAQLFLQFDSFLAPAVPWSLRDYDYMAAWRRKVDKPLSYKPAEEERSEQAVDREMAVITAKPKTEDIACLEELVEKDSLVELEEKEKERLFRCRDHYKTLPLSLPLFLRSVDWAQPLQVREALRMLKTWSPMSPEDAVCLLDTEFADEAVRFYGVRLIAQMADDQLVLYMQQLVQALQCETHHLSFLSELLLERALRNPYVVGHELFWTLRSQLHFKPSSERFALLLEQFLMLCGRFREELLAEVNMVEWLKDLGTGVKEPPDDKKEMYLRDRLRKEAPDHEYPWTLTFDSRLQCRGMKTEGSVLSSAKKPIVLTFFTSEEEPCREPEERKSAPCSRRIIFKVGDDMRQDILTIQLIRIMDSVWLENGLDLCMLTYRVSATHDQVGMVEFVGNSSTTADIQYQYGGTTGALKKDTIVKYLQEHAQNDVEYQQAVDNFIRSCAGYSVATYILGIGDRHSDNIMMTQNGQLFHIDFGHFLGNFKSAMGINRERSAFVLTEEMAYVMNKKESEEDQSEEFRRFVDYCEQAYNYIRRVGRRFLYLFQLMISAGMPELTQRKDIMYVREKLALNLTERQAAERFRDEIHIALNNYFRRVDNLLHNIKHKKAPTRSHRTAT